MRQGQQNRRGRGRNNNTNTNRGKGHHNPLSRSFESNGPAERIRGTPAHIAEKYLTLARDAQSSGDTVLEQNYLQHAEHYNRIIMAYRDQFNQPNDGMNGGGGQRGRGPGDLGESFDDGGDDDMAGDDGFQQPFAQAPQGHQSQPRQQEARQSGGEQGRPERGEPRADRPERSEQRSDQRPDRPERQDRPFRRDQRPPRFGDRGDRGERQGFVDRDRQAESRPEPRPESRAEPREPRAEAPERAPEQVADAGEPRRQRDRFQQPHEQPEFLRRPVRRARSSTSENGESGNKSEPTGE